MKRPILAALLATSTVLAAGLAFPTTANAWSRHHRHPVRHHTYRRGYYHMTMATDTTNAQLDQKFGMYPNIRYFERNGHVYYRNMDTGDVYLAQW